MQDENKFNNIQKLYRNEEGTGHPGQRCLTATGYMWMFEQGRTIQSSAAATARYSFTKATKRVLQRVQGALHSPNTLPTMVCDQAFRILPITDNSPPRGLYISTTRRRSEQLCVFDTWEPSPVCNRVITKSISSNGSRHLKGPLYTDSPSTQIHKVTLRML